MKALHFARWAARMLRDVVWLGVANDSLALSLLIVFLFLVGLLAIGAQLAAPFIYTLF